MKNLDWDHLRIVLAISRSGSLTGAARLMGLDQTTVGRRLSALETSVGASLYRRAKSGLVPTEAGLIVEAEASAVELRLAALTDQLTPDMAAAEGIVRLIGNGWMLSRLAASALPDFLSTYPGIELRLVNRLPPTRFYGEPTLSLWFDAIAHAPDQSEPFVRVPFAAYRARGLPRDSRDWVVFRDDDVEGPSFSREVLRRIGKDASIRMTATDATILAAAVRGGVGHGILPVCIGDECPDLVRSEAQVGRIDRVLHLHSSPDFEKLARLQTVLTWVRGALVTAVRAEPIR